MLNGKQQNITWHFCLSKQWIQTLMYNQRKQKEENREDGYRYYRQGEIKHTSIWGNKVSQTMAQYENS